MQGSSPGPHRVRCMFNDKFRQVSNTVYTCMGLLHLEKCLSTRFIIATLIMQIQRLFFYSYFSIRGIVFQRCEAPCLWVETHNQVFQLHVQLSFHHPLQGEIMGRHTAAGVLLMQLNSTAVCSADAGGTSGVKHDPCITPPILSQTQPLRGTTLWCLSAAFLSSQDTGCPCQRVFWRQVEERGHPESLLCSQKQSLNYFFLLSSKLTSLSLISPSILIILFILFKKDFRQVLEGIVLDC